MARDQIKFALTKDKAFAALAVLSRHVYRKEPFVARTETERQAIQELCQSIDDELLEAFRDDYKKFVKATRDDHDAS